MTKRLFLWSGPRNVSTALMYSFAQRTDTQVVDEPLYAHYLSVSGMDHPGREEILQAQVNNGNEVIGHLLQMNDKPVLFCKQMAHHLVELNLDFLTEVENLFLIRQPAEVVVSFSKVIPNPGIDDIGIRRQYELFENLKKQGKEPVILDGPELLKDPMRVLQQLCERLSIPWDQAMLNWQAGARPEDGIWAPYWYANVHLSTGFASYQPRNPEVPSSLESVVQQSQPYYEALYQHAIKSN